MTTDRSADRGVPLKSSIRFVELDGIRGLAAVGVVIYHYGMIGAKPWIGWLYPIYNKGLYLVDLFFVLSGFVLCHAFGKRAGIDRFGRNVRLRLARLYPLHLVTLLVVALTWLAFGNVLGMRNAFHSFNDTYHFLLNVLMLQSSSLEHGYSFNTPAWSISTEIIINILYFGLILLPRKWAYSVIGLIMLFCAIQLQRHGLASGDKLGGTVDFALLRTALGFFSGVVAYEIYIRRINDGAGSLRADVFAIFILLCTLCLFADWWIFSRHGRTVLTVWVFLVFPAGLIATLRSNRVRHLLARYPFQWLGKVSYALYLTHVPLLYLLIVILHSSGQLALFRSPLFLCAFLLASLALAGAVFHYFESPVYRHLRGKILSPTARIPLVTESGTA